MTREGATCVIRPLVAETLRKIREHIDIAELYLGHADAFAAADRVAQLADALDRQLRGLRRAIGRLANTRAMQQSEDMP